MKIKKTIDHKIFRECASCKDLFSWIDKEDKLLCPDCRNKVTPEERSKLPNIIRGVNVTKQAIIRDDEGKPILCKCGMLATKLVYYEASKIGYCSECCPYEPMDIT